MYCKAVEKSWHLGLAWKVLKISDCLGRGADVAEGSNFGKLRKDLSGGSTEYTEKSFGDDANGRPWISLQTNDHSKKWTSESLVEIWRQLCSHVSWEIRVSGSRVEPGLIPVKVW